MTEPRSIRTLPETPTLAMEIAMRNPIVARDVQRWDFLRWLLVLALALSGAVALRCAPASAQSSTSADPRLLEAIDWYTGVGRRVDDARARDLLLKVAEDASDPLARMWIARVHSRGRMGFERDEAKAREIAAAVIGEIRGLAADGDVEAIFLMGTAYDEGLGARVDAGEAARWYRRAATRDHVLGAHNLGNVYLAGRGVRQSDSEAVTWWLRAARAGDAITQLRLGESFEQGRGVRPDRARAIAWYRRAAESGNAQAIANLERLERG